MYLCANFAQISSLFANPVEGYELAIKALLLQVIFLLLQYRTPDGKRSVDTANASEKLKTVLDYIHLHYAEPLTVAGLAAQCYFSEYYFMRFSKTHEHDRSGIPQQSAIRKGCRTV